MSSFDPLSLGWVFWLPIMMHYMSFFEYNMKLWPTFNSTAANAQQLAISPSISCLDHPIFCNGWGPIFFIPWLWCYFLMLVITYLGSTVCHAETSALYQWGNEVPLGKWPRAIVLRLDCRVASRGDRHRNADACVSVLEILIWLSGVQPGFQDFYHLHR